MELYFDSNVPLDNYANRSLNKSLFSSFIAFLFFWKGNLWFTDLSRWSWARKLLCILSYLSVTALLSSNYKEKQVNNISKEHGTVRVAIMCYWLKKTSANWFTFCLLCLVHSLLPFINAHWPTFLSSLIGSFSLLPFCTDFTVYLWYRCFIIFYFCLL